jgi:hypothetical protein
MAPEPVSVVIDGVEYVPAAVTVVPAAVTVVPATDPVKQKIVDTFPRSNIKIDVLKKVVSHDMKTVKIGNNTSQRIVLTLDDGKQVRFKSNASAFYTVAKSDNHINMDFVETSTDKIENGTIFDNNDVYIDTSPSENNVYVPNIISGGGSRKKYRKSYRRVKSAKKSSRSRKFRNRK